MKKGGSAKPPVKDTHLGTAARLDVLLGRLAEPREREKENRSEVLRADPDAHTKKGEKKLNVHFQGFRRSYIHGFRLFN
jgi:hypothetical protein